MGIEITLKVLKLDYVAQDLACNFDFADLRLNSIFSQLFLEGIAIASYFIFINAVITSTS